MRNTFSVVNTKFYSALLQTVDKYVIQLDMLDFTVNHLTLVVYSQVLAKLADNCSQMNNS